MLKNKWAFLLLTGMGFCSYAEPEVKEIAITIDDLPFVGSSSITSGGIKRTHERFYRLMQALVDRKVPATGFIIGEAVSKDQWQLLEEFRENGFQLGNHTYTHQSLNSISADKYITDVDKADKKLSVVLTEPKYFRYPYLAEGRGEKKQKVYDYLAAHGYTIAPVTIDSKDYQFNAQLLAIPWSRRTQHLSSMKKRYLNYIWRQTLQAEGRKNRTNGGSGCQILLLHANLLNSYFLGDVIDMYLKNNYRIVSLDQALRMPAPTIEHSIEEPLPKTAGISAVLDSFLVKSTN